MRRQRERAILNVKLVLPRHESGLKRLFYDFSELADGLREGLAPCEVNLLTDVARRGFDPFPHKKGGDIDAFVFAFQKPAERVVREIRERGAGVVVLNRSMSGVPCVACDNRDGMWQLAAHLKERGVTGRTVYLGYEGIEDILEERLKGLGEATEEVGIAFERSKDVKVFSSPEDVTAAAVKPLLKRATTFVCVNDVLAAGADDGEHAGPGTGALCGASAAGDARRPGGDSPVGPPRRETPRRRNDLIPFHPH